MTDNRRLLTPSLATSGRKGRLFALLLALVVLAGAVAVYFLPTVQQERRARRGGGGGDGPVPVLATAAKRADVPVYLEGVGTARALNTVIVRPQVEGKLIRITFKEGQDIKKGDVLALIDPTIYQAQLDQAIAKKAQDEALLANARIDLERYTRLAATNSGTKQQVDTQRATVAQLEAQVRLDEGAIDNVRAILGYTSITAPISGRAGIRLVDEGNIVRTSDLLGIVVLTEIQPITVVFNLPQQVIARVNAAFARGPLQVEALTSDTEQVIDRGVLQVVDNQVDPTTGTVRLKAEFPNANLQLWSGQFVNIRMRIDTLEQVIVVPTAAVQRGPEGPFVFVVRPDETVAVRKVAVTQQDDVQAVLSSGVRDGEQIVTTGFSQLADGTRVGVTAGESSQPPPAPLPSRGRRNRGGQGAAPQASTPPATTPPPADAPRPAQQRSSTGAAASPAQ